MDFDKPPRTLAPGPPAKLADFGDPSEEMFVWQPTVGPADSTTPSCPNPMTVQAPGIDTGISLAAKLNWGVLAETNHQQVEIRVGESVISVDREIADHEVLELFDAALIACATSCIGTAETWGYFMFISADSAQRFLRIWHRYLMPLGYPMPELDFTARDEEWRVEIGSKYPFPQAVPVDEEGLTSTARWREHRENMIEILPKLAWALRRYLRSSAEN